MAASFISNQVCDVAYWRKADIVQRWREMARSLMTQSGHYAVSTLGYV
jgi:hypothetical protein